MKRSSTSSSVHESCEKQPAVKRSWGLGSLLHGLAGYVRPKNSSSKEKPTRNDVQRGTETLSNDSRGFQTTIHARSAVNDRVPVHSDVNIIDSMKNETSVHVLNYESSLSRSSTFSYTQSTAGSANQQQRTPLLPRFRRTSRNR